MEDIDFRSSKRGLDGYTETVWGGFILNDLKSISGGVVVDMGCGDGRYTSQLASNNEYYGVDINGGAKAANVIATVEDVPLGTGIADNVIAIGILDYSDTHKTISEANRLLKRGGYLRVMVPNSASPYHIMQIVSRFGKYKKTFIRPEIRHIILDWGFDIELCHIDGFCFYVPFKWLQELCVPVFNMADKLLGFMFGNNIYIRARKR